MNVALPGRVLEERAQEGHRADEFDNDGGTEEAEQSPHEGEHQSLKENLNQDMPAPGAKGFENADLLGPVGDGNKHDVHDPDSADAEREGADDS